MNKLKFSPEIKTKQSKSPAHRFSKGKVIDLTNKKIYQPMYSQLRSNRNNY